MDELTVTKWHHSVLLSRTVMCYWIISSTTLWLGKEPQTRQEVKPMKKISHRH